MPGRVGSFSSDMSRDIAALGALAKTNTGPLGVHAEEVAQGLSNLARALGKSPAFKESPDMREKILDLLTQLDVAGLGDMDLKNNIRWALGVDSHDASSTSSRLTVDGDFLSHASSENDLHLADAPLTTLLSAFEMDKVSDSKKSGFLHGLLHGKQHALEEKKNIQTSARSFADAHQQDTLNALNQISICGLLDDAKSFILKNRPEWISKKDKLTDLACGLVIGLLEGAVCGKSLERDAVKQLEVLIVQSTTHSEQDFHEAFESITGFALPNRVHVHEELIDVVKDNAQNDLRESLTNATLPEFKASDKDKRVCAQFMKDVSRSDFSIALNNGRPSIRNIREINHLNPDFITALQELCEGDDELLMRVSKIASQNLTNCIHNTTFLSGVWEINGAPAILTPGADYDAIFNLSKDSDGNIKINLVYMINAIAVAMHRDSGKTFAPNSEIPSRVTYAVNVTIPKDLKNPLAVEDVGLTHDLNF